MNPVKKLDAAITKLETLKESSSPAPWEIVRDEYHDKHTPVHLYRAAEEGWEDYERDLIFSAMTADDYSGPREIDGELIVTLHRTIEAQLEILRRSIEAAHIERNWDTLVYTVTAVALADAILGDLS